MVGGWEREISGGCLHRQHGWGSVPIHRHSRSVSTMCNNYALLLAIQNPYH